MNSFASTTTSDFTIPNLASRILALNLKRLSGDWQTLYGHPLCLVETFVDPRHFKGTCYKAQGWLFLGHTRGFSKCSTRYYYHGNPKMVFVRLLHPDGKRMLREPFIKNLSFQEVKPMQLSLKHAESLKEHLSSIPDPRFRRGIRHRKLPVLFSYGRRSCYRNWWKNPQGLSTARRF